MSQLPLLSIVLPAHNESDNIRPMYKALVDVLSHENLDDFEIIFVDDGSTDNTADMVENLHHADERVKLVQLFRNFGHQSAFSAGIAHTKGDAVITMDADLQHPPSTITQMLDKYRRGFDVVYTIRDGKQAGFVKNIADRFFYLFFRKVTRLDIQGNASDFRLMSRQIVNVLNSMPEKDRFLRGMTPWIGGRYACLKYKVEPRLHGKASYDFNKSFHLALAGLLSFSTLPLKYMFVLGMTFCLLSFMYGIFLVGHKIFIGTSVPGYTDIIASILFLGGLQLACLSVVGKFIAVVLDEVRARPNYIIRRCLGLENETSHETNMTYPRKIKFAAPMKPLDITSLLSDRKLTGEKRKLVTSDIDGPQDE